MEGGEIGGDAAEPSADFIGEDAGVGGEEVPGQAAGMVIQDVPEDGAAAQAGATWASRGLACVLRRRRGRRRCSQENWQKILTVCRQPIA